MLRQRKRAQNCKADATGGKSIGILSTVNDNDDPAYTVVPVLGMSLIHLMGGGSNPHKKSKIGILLIAKHMTSVDMVQMEMKM